MTIVDRLVAEVQEACAAEAIAQGRPRDAGHIRADGSCSTARMVGAGLDAIRKYFKDYEEVEAERAKDGDLYPKSVYGSFEERHTGREAVTLFVSRAPEMLTVSRETLVALADHYEATPTKDAAGDAAHAEAKEAIA